MVDVLVQAGSDVNADEFREVTPLHFVATAGPVEIIELLLKNGANPEAKDGIRGNRPVELAIYNAKWDIVLALINAGSAIDVSKLEGRFEVNGQYGESQLIEKADAFLSVSYDAETNKVVRTAFLITSEDGEFYDVILPKPGDPANAMDLVLGEPGQRIDIEGGIGGLSSKGVLPEVTFLQLMIGPSGALKGSYLIASGDGTETLAEAVRVTSGVTDLPEGALLFRVTEKLEFQEVDESEFDSIEVSHSASQTIATRHYDIDEFAPLLIAKSAMKPDAKLLDFISSNIDSIAAGALAHEVRATSPLDIDISACFGGWFEGAEAPVEVAFSDFIWNYFYYERVFTDFDIPDEVWRHQLDTATAESLAFSHGALANISNSGDRSPEEGWAIEGMVGVGVWILFEELSKSLRQHNIETFDEPGEIPTVVRCIG